MKSHYDITEWAKERARRRGSSAPVQALARLAVVGLSCALAGCSGEKSPAANPPSPPLSAGSALPASSTPIPKTLDVQTPSAAGDLPWRSYLELARREDVRKALSLTPGQVKTIASIHARDGGAMDFAIARPKDTLAAPEVERRISDKSWERRTEENRQVVALLDAAQQKRLDQIDLQWQGVMILEAPPIAAGIGISKEHQAEAAKLARSYRARHANMVEELRKQEMAKPGDHTVSDPVLETKKKFARARLALADLREVIEGRITSLLSREELAAWRTACGEEFNFGERSVD